MRNNVTNVKPLWSANITLVGSLGVLGGIWLIISPYLLGYADMAGALKVNNDNATLTGLIGGVIAIALAVFCIIAERIPATQPYRFAAGIGLLGLGLGLMMAPYLFNYAVLRDPLWNLQITGAVFVLVAGYIMQELYSLNRVASPV